MGAEVGPTALLGLTESQVGAATLQMCPWGYTLGIRDVGCVNLELHFPMESCCKRVVTGRMYLKKRGVSDSNQFIKG